ncbi:class I SAM-dependent methyltransferase [Parapedobacter indicus]|uniref:tRNA (Cmo5U34)-methyltransferase n=1 Tax=Parapedobacter indicus TaxID=1477437 RepID=A0A1I3FZF6_9SPHI|nr:class I SAM-dependent methyltransferase [Parapedobacter indicus]PPL03962.1 tRNA (cmo5U34)-methyltransferase [Parapedobacter indicus]SFI16610.1 tRNA (cmo5U34)-methyltransferase [Parapedobacter indicus]
MENFSDKSTVQEIKARFDTDVDRFSNLETGQQTTIDASFSMELIVDSIMAYSPNLKTVLDVGCGAGNYTLKLLSRKAPLDCTLLDLSQPMLDRAKERIAAVNTGAITLMQDDIRTANLPENHYCTIMAAAVLHHLRDDSDWEAVFSKLYRLLKPGGSLWITDLVVQETPAIQQLVYRERYGSYLAGLKDEAYRDGVFAYIEKEDSPRSVNFQFKLLEKVGFRSVELLHKHLCFAAFGAIK